MKNFPFQRHGLLLFFITLMKNIEKILLKKNYVNSNHENEIDEITEDIEPNRVSFDPICGFDKLNILKNKKIKEIEVSFDFQNPVL